MVGNGCCRGFSGIQHRAAAHRQDGITAGATAYGLLHHTKGGVGADTVKNHRFHPVFLELRKGLIQLAAAHHAGGSHHQHPVAADLPQQLRRLAQPPGSDVGKGGGLFDGHNDRFAEGDDKAGKE